MTESLGLAWELTFEGCVLEDDEGTVTALDVPYLQRLRPRAS